MYLVHRLKPPPPPPPAGGAATPPSAEGVPDPADTSHTQTHTQTHTRTYRHRQRVELRTGSQTHTHERRHQAARERAVGERPQGQRRVWRSPPFGARRQPCPRLSLDVSGLHSLSLSLRDTTLEEARGSPPPQSSGLAPARLALLCAARPRSSWRA